MFKISLVNMPFADLWFPSIACTQLKAMLEEQFGGDVRVRVLYMNQEIAQYMGVKLYCCVSNSLETNMAAFGDWLFRDVAFPGLDDNTQAYFQRCFPGTGAEIVERKQQVLRKRKGLATTLDRLVAKYELADEDIVGFTSMFCQNVASFAMARRIKDRNPNVITVLGGANCEAPMGPELVRNVEQIDYVFSGPALISFPQFVRSCMAGDSIALENIQGVSSKKNAAFPVLGKEVLGQELDINHYLRLDYKPFLDTLESNFSSQDISPVLLFETSRGCWWGEKAHCTFCGLNGGTMAYRSMRPEIAIRQFTDLFEYASRCSTFNCVDNILPKNYVREVLPFIDAPENVEIFYEVKADLSRDEVQSLSRTRVKRVQPGIEALNTSTLKLMKKGTTVFQNLALLKNCLTYGVHPEWNLLIGFPGEQAKVFEKYVRDIPLLAHLPPPTGVFHVRFDRYSPYFVKANEYGLNLQPSDFYNFIYPFSQGTLEKIAYYFSNHDYSAPYLDAVANWSARVREQGRRWRGRWEGSPGEVFPRLFWKSIGDKTLIYDSRFGAKIEHELESDAIALLKLLEKPKRKADLLGQFQGSDGERHFDELERLGLVFEEEQRYMSLVTDAPASEEEPIAIYQLASESPSQGVLA